VYHVSGDTLELAIPREVFGDSTRYAFKWSDNVPIEGDMVDFALSGDAAPNRRAQYLVDAVPMAAHHHSADTDRNYRIDTSELLEVVQLYAPGAYHCTDSNGYGPGPGDTTACTAHDSDYAPRDWAIDLSELLRLVQFVNAGGYHACADAVPPVEDGFCPGAG